jgi:Ca2+-binding EF-hand superfamily protein
MKLKYFLIAAAVIVSFGVMAAEQSVSEKFKELDKDGNGYISQEEAQGDKKLVQQFDKVDADTDGQLEMSEFAAFESGEAAGFEPPDNPDEPGIGAAPMD